MAVYPLYRIPDPLFRLEVEVGAHPHYHKVIIDRFMEDLIARCPLQLGLSMGNAFSLAPLPEFTEEGLDMLVGPLCPRLLQHLCVIKPTQRDRTDRSSNPGDIEDNDACNLGALSPRYETRIIDGGLRIRGRI